MPTYAYKCPACKFKRDILKRVKDLDDRERCWRCGGESEHVIEFQGKMSPDIWDYQFNYGLGKHFKSRTEVKEHLRRIRGETGRTIYEIGNDTPRIERPSMAIDKERAVADIRRIRGF